MKVAYIGKQTARDIYKAIVSMTILKNIKRMIMMIKMIFVTTKKEMSMELKRYCIVVHIFIGLGIVFFFFVVS